MPLLYYIFPFQNYFGDVFFPLLQSSPIVFIIIYILIFSATKQVGALLFSPAFWTASSVVRDDRIRKSLLVSSIGMVMLFGSTELAPLQYRVYPPYGLITEAFLQLGAYLFFVGIFISTKHISQDTKLRKEIHKSATSQLDLLKTIGVSQMEKEFEGKIKSLQKHYGLIDKNNELVRPQVEYRLEDEDVKQIIHDVLNELYYSKGGKGNSQPT